MTFTTWDTISYDMGRRASLATALKTPGQGLAPDTEYRGHMVETLARQRS